MPYSLYQCQYFRHGMVCGSKVRETERLPCPRLARFYAEKVMPEETAAETAERIGNNLTKNPVRFIHCGLAGFRPLDRLSQPRVGTVAALAVVLMAGFNCRWMRFCWATICLTLTAQALVYWWHPHYSAPLFPLLYLVVGHALRATARACHLRLETRRWVPMALISLAGVWALASDGRLALEGFRTVRAPSCADVTDRRIGSRIDLQRRLLQQSGRHLVFVNYDDKYSVHDEWVYNAADMSSAHIVFAHDLGDEKNGRLIELNRDRRVWRASVSDAEKTLEPY
jgi:hypothetical protein